MKKKFGINVRPVTITHIAIYGLILSSVGIAVIIPSDEFFGGISWNVPRIHGSQFGPKEFSSSILWLLVANISSLGAVILLYSGLITARNLLDDCNFRLDEQKAINLGFSMDKIQRHLASRDESAKSWARKPLTPILPIVILVIVFLAFVIFYISYCAVQNKAISDFSYLLIVLWTGVIYIFTMTACDYLAKKAFRRFGCLNLVLQKSPREDESPEKIENERSIKKWEELKDLMGDFERMFIYMDFPFLIGAILALIHKMMVLDPGTYYYGFLSGAIAMHTILANFVALFIAAHNGDMNTELS